jgi:hypothetical protein
MLSLAPDALLARAAERMANPHGWLALGTAGDVMWGEFPNANRPPYHVLATLPELAFFCDCAARKRPCRHAVSLALLAAREQESFMEKDPPEWVRRQLSTRPSLAQTTHASGKAQAAAIANYEERLLTVQKGMRQFERWLKDIVHRGLAGLPSLPIAQWNEMASRLSEAAAPEIAQDIRDLRPLAGSQRGWPEATLRRLGRLYLLSQGFAGYKKLPPEAQADLRSAVGWFEDPLHPGDELLSDRWLVLGTVHNLQGRHNVRRTWLYGLEHRRFAYVSRQSQKEILEPALFSGTTLAAALRFAPGGWPQRASMEALRAISPQGAAIHSYRSLKDARSAYGKALSVNPWLRHFPMVLSRMQAELDGGQWVLRDSEGYGVPLPQPFLYGWHLQVMGSTDGSALFGEWDGLCFSPLAAFHNNTWLTLRVLRGQK